MISSAAIAVIGDETANIAAKTTPQVKIPEFATGKPISFSRTNE
jgi:hypothetical protein